MGSERRPVEAVDLAAARQALGASTDAENRELVQHLEAAEGLEGQIVTLLEEADSSLRMQLETRLERVRAIVLEDRRKVLLAAETLATDSDLQALSRSGNPEDQREAKRCRRVAARAAEALAIAEANPRSQRAVEFADTAVQDYQAAAERVRRRTAARGVKDRAGRGTYVRAYARLALAARAARLPACQLGSPRRRSREARPGASRQRGSRRSSGLSPPADDPDAENPPGDVEAPPAGGQVAGPTLIGATA